MINDPIRRWLKGVVFVSTVLTAALQSHAGLNLANVEVLAEGEFRHLELGVQAHYNATSGRIYEWYTLGAPLNVDTLDFWYNDYDPSHTHPSNYGLLEFNILSDGPVWLLVTARFENSGNPDGDWMPELTTQAELEADGWAEITRDVTTSHDDGLNLQEWILYERACLGGEAFTLRTEKYHSPIPLMRIGLLGDLNDDGWVGQIDLSIVLTYWGGNVTAGDLLMGDPSGDGFVGQTDLDYVLAYWGQGTPPLAPVPEPATLAMFAFCGFALLGRKSKSR